MIHDRQVRRARTTRPSPLLRPAAAGLRALARGLPAPVSAQSPLPGRNVESLLEIARERNPEFASMRFEAAAAREKPESAGAFPDPTFRDGAAWTSPTRAWRRARACNPSKIGGTKYTVMQMLPWFGKRDAHARGGRGGRAGRPPAARTPPGSRSPCASRPPTRSTTSPSENEKLTREVLDLMSRLESVAQARYAGGLAAAAGRDPRPGGADHHAHGPGDDRVGTGAARPRASTRSSRGPVSAPLRRPSASAPCRRRRACVPADLEERARARNPLIAGRGGARAVRGQDGRARRPQPLSGRGPSASRRPRRATGSANGK